MRENISFKPLQNPLIYASCIILEDAMIVYLSALLKKTWPATSKPKSLCFTPFPTHAQPYNNNLAQNFPNLHYVKSSSVFFFFPKAEDSITLKTKIRVHEYAALLN